MVSDIYIYMVSEVTIHAPVAKEELRGLHAPLRRALAQRGEGGAGGHPDGVQVGDGRAGDDVAPQGGHVADLVAGKPPGSLHKGGRGRVLCLHVAKPCTLELPDLCWHR